MKINVCQLIHHQQYRGKNWLKSGLSLEEDAVSAMKKLMVNKKALAKVHGSVATVMCSRDLCGRGMFSEAVLLEPLRALSAVG